MEYDWPNDVKYRTPEGAVFYEIPKNWDKVDLSREPIDIKDLPELWPIITDIEAIKRIYKNES